MVPQDVPQLQLAAAAEALPRTRRRGPSTTGGRAQAGLRRLKWERLWLALWSSQLSRHVLLRFVFQF